MSEHHTEVDDWQAIWRLEHHGIRIMLVRNVFESSPLMSVTAPTSAPDLAQMREQFPKLSRLWDAIRHEYWSEFLSPQKHSQGTI
ncbi:hypothetical protein OG563_40605 [Nocardia vinacea]|uniref:Uncharacterized protein n=1 Tax=Nocardia vinacea TaxID=96468 RepID=A0ABZ1YQ20_9NOCA|nr:hypothetical protein [Nocardia vinacea]